MKFDKKPSKIDQLRRHAFSRLLVNPFSSATAKIPKYSMGRTFTFRRILSYTQALTNTNGCFVFFEPDQYANTAATNTPLLVDNQATYNPTTGATTAIAGVSLTTALGLNSDNIDQIRVVACGMRLWITDSPLNMKGNLYGGVTATTHYALSAGGATAVPQGIYTLPYLLKMDHVNTPLKDPDLGLVYNYRQRGIMSIEGHSLTAGFTANTTTDRFVAIATGFANTAVLNIQIAYHFEVTVDPNGEYAEFASYHTSTVDPFDVVSVLSSDPGVFLRTGRMSEEDTVSNEVSVYSTEKLKDLPGRETHVETTTSNVHSRLRKPGEHW
jgi:hypothetical protein